MDIDGIFFDGGGSWGSGRPIVASSDGADDRSLTRRTLALGLPA